MTHEDVAEAILTASGNMLSTEVAAKFSIYLDLLLKWNARLNLTAIRNPEEILRRHFVECIRAAKHLPSGIETLLDFGSGGGFPGIPFALCHPEIHVTLSESQGKKAAFLREVIRSVEMPNVHVFHGRAETLKDTFGAVALRAVDKMEEACRATVPLIRAGGYLILLTTHDAAEKMKADIAGFQWEAPAALEEGTHRVLLSGRKTAL